MHLRTPYNMTRGTFEPQFCFQPTASSSQKARHLEQHGVSTMPRLAPMQCAQRFYVSLRRLSPFSRMGSRVSERLSTQFLASTRQARVPLSVYLDFRGSVWSTDLPVCGSNGSFQESRLTHTSVKDVSITA